MPFLLSHVDGSCLYSAGADEGRSTSPLQPRSTLFAISFHFHRIQLRAKSAHHTACVRHHGRCILRAVSCPCVLRLEAHSSYGGLSAKSKRKTTQSIDAVVIRFIRHLVDDLVHQFHVNVLIILSIIGAVRVLMCIFQRLDKCVEREHGCFACSRNSISNPISACVTRDVDWRSARR